MRRAARRAAVTAVTVAVLAAGAACADPPAFGDGDCFTDAPGAPVRSVPCEDPAAALTVVFVIAGEDETDCVDHPGTIAYVYRASDRSDYTVCLGPR